MAEKCANCHNNFSLRSDGKGFTRHSMTAKLRNITVADAISICCSKDVTPRKRADLLFLCPECFRLLRDLYDKTIATDTFTTRTAEDSYMHKKRTRTPTQTPRAIKKRMISTPLKKTPLKPARENRVVRISTSESIRKAVQYLSLGQYIRGMRRLLQASPGMRRAIRQCVSEEVRKEVSIVCNQDHKLAEYATLDTLEKFSWMNIISDMRERTPFLFSLLFATQHKGKTILTDATNMTSDLCRTIGCFFSMLLFKRNRKFKLFQTVNSIQLWMGGCKASVMTQCNRMGWCLSGNATRGAIDRIRKDFDRDVQKAKENIEDHMEETVLEKDDPLLPMDVDLQEEENDDGWETDENIEQPQARRQLFERNADNAEGIHPGYTLCWDNIGRHTKARHQTKERQNKMHLWALAYITMNRVPTTHLSLTDAIQATDIPIVNFLPSNADLMDMKGRLKHAVSHILCQYVPFFRENFCINPDVPHDNIDLLKTKSRLVNLGIIQENPSSVAGTIAILEHLQEYVPVKDNTFSTCIVYGDGLSCERHNDSHNARSNGNSPKERLEGVEPSPQEFHKRMLLLQDTMDIFFSGSSACDKGTLSNIKNAYGHIVCTERREQLFQLCCRFIGPYNR